MATMLDVLRTLDEYEQSNVGERGMLSGTVADQLWPSAKHNKPHHGGPDGGQRAAAGLLGRLARKGLVTQDWRPGDPRTWWKLTPHGYEQLRTELRTG